MSKEGKLLEKVWKIKCHPEKGTVGLWDWKGEKLLLSGKRHDLTSNVGEATGAQET